MNIAVFSDSFIERAGIIFLLNDSLHSENLIEAHNFETLQIILKKKQVDILVIFGTSDNYQCILEIISFLNQKYETKCLLVLSEFIPEKHKILIETKYTLSILLKQSDEEEFRAALKSIVTGNRYICSRVTNTLLNKRALKNEKREKHKLLTLTETEILKEISLGKTTKEIAAMRNVSIHTVMTHRKNIFRKIEVNSVYEASKYAMRAGIVELAEYYI